MNILDTKKGFTLVELLIVIGIISVLLSIVLVSISQARANARDKARVIDIEQMKLNLRLYREAYSSYPVATTETKINEIGDLNLIKLIGTVPTDPSTGSNFGYYYDSNFTCSATGQRVVFAKNMESSGKANFSSVCTDPNADISVAGSDSYIVIIN